MTDRPADTAEPRCWWCGIEPDDVIELHQLGSAHPRRLYTWPPGNHQHSVTPPTPQELDADGHATFRRIMERI